MYVTSLCTDYAKGQFTSFNGNIAVCADSDDARATVYASDNTTPLKDTEWFREHRTAPDAWKAA